MAGKRMNIYHFDTLPLHPQPEALESFTSYLTRLAEANGIQSVRHLSKLCFPGDKGNFGLNGGDYPYVTFGDLSRVTLCPEATLRATTFYHLGRKFGRLTQAQPLSQFLSGSVAKQLRYCPHCLVERGYYRLTWRFLALPGCPEHGCQLLDRCGQCGQSIPLLAQPLKLGVCPHCGHHLGLCSTEALSQTEWRTARTREDDLTFLLRPQPCERGDSQHLKQQVGEQFARWRQIRRMKVADAAEYLEQSVAIIYYIEEGPAHRGIKFCWYLHYADFLWIELRTIFERSLPQRRLPTYEEKLVAKVTQVVSIFEQQGQPVTQAAVARMVGIGVKAFTGYPRLRALWATNRARWRQEHIAGLVEQVHQIAEGLEQTDQRITKSEIYRQIGWTRDGLSRYPQVTAALEQVTGTKEAAKREHRRVDRLLELAQAALTDLETSGQRVSKQAISNRVGVSVKELERSPRLKSFLLEQVTARIQEHQARQRQHREQQLILMIRAAAETLLTAGVPVTQKAILTTIGKNRSTLEHYPGAYACLRQAALEAQGVSREVMKG
jgi:hypothetical protein